MRRHAITLVLFAAVAGALAALGALLLPASAGAVQPTQRPVVAAAEPAAHTVAVHSTSPADDADAAFLADLFGEGTDYTPEQATALTELGRRIAAQLSNPAASPGAEVPTRESYMATLTLPQPSLTTGFSSSEAGKIIDCALAAYAG